MFIDLYNILYNCILEICPGQRRKYGNLKKKKLKIMLKFIDFKITLHPYVIVPIWLHTEHTKKSTNK